MVDTGFCARWIFSFIEPKLCQSLHWRSSSPATPNDSLLSFLCSIAPLVALRARQRTADLGAHVYEGCRARDVNADIPDVDLYHGELSITAEACLQLFKTFISRVTTPASMRAIFRNERGGILPLFQGWGMGHRMCPILINEEVAQGEPGWFPSPL
jgi:hypothetical protein